MVAQICDFDGSGDGRPAFVDACDVPGVGLAILPGEGVDRFDDAGAQEYAKVAQGDLGVLDDVVEQRDRVGVRFGAASRDAKCVAEQGAPRLVATVAEGDARECAGSGRGRFRFLVYRCSPCLPARLWVCSYSG